MLLSRYGFPQMKYPGARMMSYRTFLACALAAGSLVPAQADYIAETGRSQKQEISAESMGEISRPASDPHAGMAGHNHNHDAPTTFALANVALTDLYDAGVEKALLESGIEQLAVQSEGINLSLRTFAEVQVNAITGQNRPKMEDGRRMDPIYAVLGMIYQNKAWVQVPIIPVEDAKLAERMGLDPGTHNRVSPVWVMKTPAARSLVMPALQGVPGMTSHLSADEKKALDKFAYRIGVFLSLPNEFKLVPLMGEVKGEWLAPTHLEETARISDADLQARVAALDLKATPYAETLALNAALQKAYDEKESAGVAGASTALLKVLDGTSEYMSPFVRKLDYWNTRIHPFQKAALLSMLSFFAFLVYLLTVRRRKGTGGGGGSEPSQQRPSGWEREAEPVSPASVEPSPLVSAFSASPALAVGGGGTVAYEGVNAMPISSSGPILRRPGSDAGFGYGDPSLQAEQEVGKGSPVAWGVGYSLLVASAVMMVAALVARFLIGGRMPVSNMYESITFAMASFAIVSAIFEAIYRRAWVGIGAAFAGWVLMTGANSLPLHMRKVEPLVAVLKSVWLNFHVTSLLISYSAFLLAFVCGVLYFIKDFGGNRPGVLPRKEMFEYLSYRAIQVGWPLLTLGVFLGAVWANTAWGSYWSWDPKETWALITWFAYTIYLHLRMIMGWTNRRAVIANMVGFLMVLITYFGVSYLPWFAGGMHSYAAPISK